MSDSEQRKKSLPSSESDEDNPSKKVTDYKEQPIQVQKETEPSRPRNFQLLRLESEGKIFKSHKLSLLRRLSHNELLKRLYQALPSILKSSKKKKEQWPEKKSSHLAKDRESIPESKKLEKALSEEKTESRHRLCIPKLKEQRKSQSVEEKKSKPTVDSQRSSDMRDPFSSGYGSWGSRQISQIESPSIMSSGGIPSEPNERRLGRILPTRSMSTDSEREEHLSVSTENICEFSCTSVDRESEQVQDDVISQTFRPFFDLRSDYRRLSDEGVSNLSMAEEENIEEMEGEENSSDELAKGLSIASEIHVNPSEPSTSGYRPIRELSIEPERYEDFNEPSTSGYRASTKLSTTPKDYVDFDEPLTKDYKALRELSIALKRNVIHDQLSASGFRLPELLISREYQEDLHKASTSGYRASTELSNVPKYYADLIERPTSEYRELLELSIAPEPFVDTNEPSNSGHAVSTELSNVPEYYADLKEPSTSEHRELLELSIAPEPFVDTNEPSNSGHAVSTELSNVPEVYAVLNEPSTSEYRESLKVPISSEPSVDPNESSTSEYRESLKVPISSEPSVDPNEPSTSGYAVSTELSNEPEYYADPNEPSTSEHRELLELPIASEPFLDPNVQSTSGYEPPSQLEESNEEMLVSSPTVRSPFDGELAEAHSVSSTRSRSPNGNSRGGIEANEPALDDIRRILENIEINRDARSLASDQGSNSPSSSDPLPNGTVYSTSNITPLSSPMNVEENQPAVSNPLVNQPAVSALNSPTASDVSEITTDPLSSPSHDSCCESVKEPSMRKRVLARNFSLVYQKSSEVSKRDVVGEDNRVIKSAEALKSVSFNFEEKPKIKSREFEDLLVKKNDDKNDKYRKSV